MRRSDVLALGGYFEDVGDDPDDIYLMRFSPSVSVALCDDIAVSIAASDECFHDDVNLIGLPLEAVAWRLGGVAEQTEAGEVEIYVMGTGLELYVRDGCVSRVILSDWTLVKERDQ